MLVNFVICDLLTYFNSIKVQLKRICANVFGFATIFQFHKGTIKAS